MDVRIRIRFENGAMYIEWKHSDVIVHFLPSSLCNGFTQRQRQSHKLLYAQVHFPYSVVIIIVAKLTLHYIHLCRTIRLLHCQFFQEQGNFPSK